MRVLFIFILFFSESVFARNFVGKSKIKNPINIIMNLEACEAAEGEPCLDIDNPLCQKNGKIDMRRCKVGIVDNIDGIVIDPAGVIAADAEDKAVSDDKIARDAAKGPRETSLQQCVQDTKNPTITPIQSKDCLQALSKQLLELLGKLAAEDI